MPRVLVLLQARNDNSVNFKHLMLASEQTKAANTTLRCFLCSDKQKIFFCFSFNKRFQKHAARKSLFFCIRFSSQTKSKSAKKNTGQCFLSKEKPTCSVVANRRLPAKIRRLKKQQSPGRFLACDSLVKHNRHFHRQHNRLNLIFSRKPNFLATTLHMQKLRQIWAKKKKRPKI